MTLPVFQSSIVSDPPLLNAVARLNICAIVVTLPVFHAETLWSNSSAKANIDAMVVTFPVLSEIGELNASAS